MVPHKFTAARKKRKEITEEKKVEGGRLLPARLSQCSCGQKKRKVLCSVQLLQLFLEKPPKSTSLAFAQSVATLLPVVSLNPHFTFYNEDN